MRPCPYCGQNDTNLVARDGLPPRVHQWRFAIMCGACGYVPAPGPKSVSQEAAQEEWNTRAIEDRLLAALKTLVRVMDKPNSTKDEVYDAVQGCHAAIAKAEGGGT